MNKVMISKPKTNEELLQEIKRTQIEKERYALAIEEIKYYVDECLSCGDEMNPWKVDEILERLENQSESNKLLIDEFRYLRNIQPIQQKEEV